LLYSTKLFELVNAQCVLVFVLSIVLCSGCQKLFIADERNLQAVTLWTESVVICTFNKLFTN